MDLVGMNAGNPDVTVHASGRTELYLSKLHALSPAALLGVSLKNSMFGLSFTVAVSCARCARCALACLLACLLPRYPPDRFSPTAGH
jgi:hypothetical protein